MKKISIAIAMFFAVSSCTIFKNDALIKSSIIKSSDDVFVTTIQQPNSVESGLEYTIYVSDSEGIIDNLKVLGKERVGIKKSDLPGVWEISKTSEETEMIILISDLIPYRRPVRFPK